jgi:hypothetical protein
MTTVDFDAVDRLLHDAGRAHAGAGFADAMRDAEGASELRTKRNRLIQHAISLDPKHESPVWREVADALSATERDRVARSRLDTFMADVCDMDPADDGDDAIRISYRDLRVIAERHIGGGA